MKADNESALSKTEAAIERLRASNEEYRADNEKLRTDMEKSFNAHTTKMMIFIGVAVGVITLILRFL
ncbi:MAG: hypothetical protein OXF05_08710 [Hyphomicrobiales bacterium]|nr:hypothetical protein [Hyphomicrobiales bacterium]